jgi:hypothetical protein
MPVRRSILALVALGAVLVMALGAVGGATARNDQLATIKAATSRFHSLAQAEAAGYGPIYMCTEQPGVGTMGWHYANGALVGDPALDPLQPEVLVYEPKANGGYRLVAIEYVKLAPGVPRTATPPTVLGTSLTWMPGPENIEGLPANRYGLPNFYQLHLWLYDSNPLGLFADWNPEVTCRGTGDGGG